MNLQFAIAGALALIGAAIHGGVGEALVVTRLRHEVLEPTRFGGPKMTKLMIRVTWHITTLAFLVMGSAMAVCSPNASTAGCEAVAQVTAVSFTSFGLVAMALAVATQGSRAVRTLVRHPGPLVFLGVAVLSWWGSVS